MSLYSELKAKIYEDHARRRSIEAKVLKLALELQKPGNESIRSVCILTPIDASFFIHNLESLRLVRKFLKSIWPDYTDKLVNVFPSGDRGCGVYETSIDSEIKIYLSAPFEEFPYLQDGCSFKKIPIKETRWVYTCDN